MHVLTCRFGASAAGQWKRKLNVKQKYKEYKNQGIWTKLMLEMIDYLKNKGYKQCSLAVQKANYAVKMYKNVGF